MKRIDARLRSIGDHNLPNMRALVGAIAKYPVVQRGVCDLEAFNAVIQAAKAELAQVVAQPYLRL
jgi:hypothetical protein